LALNPNSANTHYFYAMEFLVPQSVSNQALNELHTAMSLDPLSPILNTNYASVLTMAHRYMTSRRAVPESLAGRPRFKPAHPSCRRCMQRWVVLARPVSELQKFVPTPRLL
jgi:predicted Zn-dependent protease